MDKKVQISLFSMEMRTLEPSPPGFSQPGTSKEYSCEVASSAGTMDLWTLGAKKGPDLRIYQELNTLDFKAQHLELEIQEKTSEKWERRPATPSAVVFLCLAGSTTPPFGSRYNFLQKKGHSATQNISLYVIFMEEISKKTTMWWELESLECGTGGCLGCHWSGGWVRLTCATTSAHHTHPPTLNTHQTTIGFDKMKQRTRVATWLCWGGNH